MGGDGRGQLAAAVAPHAVGHDEQASLGGVGEASAGLGGEARALDQQRALERGHEELVLVALADLAHVGGPEEVGHHRGVVGDRGRVGEAPQAATAGGQFGSGWGWLVLDGGKLKVVSTGNADLPMKHGQTALFTVDVWEHAYYLDYQNARPNFIGTILDKLANWDFVAKNLAEANSAAS
ncbi:MAG: Fe-Mn family superoxide dismutase [Planctomycetes bacterium]|nr:Fe-Mn family superoxide dismutase [Planctomycetota bacterium]